MRRRQANIWNQANPLYLSVNWEASGGGAFAIIPLDARGRLPEAFPLFRGHTGPVLDTDFNPFNDQIVASGSDDGKVFIWEIPENFSVHTEAEEPEDIGPVSKLTGHSRYVVFLIFFAARIVLLCSINETVTDTTLQKSWSSPVQPLCREHPRQCQR